MNPVEIANPAIFLKTKFITQRKGSGLPTSLTVVPNSSKGSNNAFHKVKENETIGYR